MTVDPTEARRVRYVAMYETGERGKSYFRVVYLEFPDGMIPPPTISLGVPHGGVHQFGLADTQAEAAALFGTTQQSVGRWMRNEAPSLADAPVDLAAHREDT